MRDLACHLPPGGAGGNHPARAAARLAGAAAAVLPRRDRPRYTEEYQGDLADLAAAGVGRWQQLRHSSRLLAASVSLRVVSTRAQRRGKAA